MQAPRLVCLIVLPKSPRSDVAFSMTTLQEIQQTAIQPLETAVSLPFAAYTDPAILAAESEAIFSKEWVFMCMAGELKAAGDYYATSLANEPIIILRDDNKKLRALSNVCRHRGTKILDAGFGKIDNYIICPYHAWAYSKEGALEAIPYNKVIAVDRTEHQLPNFSVATWNGLVFVNLDPDAKPLTDRLAGIDRYLQLFQSETFNQVTQGSVELWQTNWKLAMENAMESYHLFKVHETTLETYSPTRDAYYIAGSSEWTLTGGKTKHQQSLVEKMLGRTHHELFEHYVLVSLPPSFVGILSYGTFGWLSAHPIDERTTQIRSGSTYSGKPQRGSKETNDFTKAFFREDKEICERVQRGMASPSMQGGKLVDMERVIVDFHQFLGTRLGNMSATNLFEDEAALLWKSAKENQTRARS